MIKLETRISLERSRELAYCHIRTLPGERVGLAAGYNRILAQQITAPIDTPPFDRSPLDGYAYQAGPLDEAPVQLKVVAEIPAGNYLATPLRQGECAKIFTGAPIPKGANCVVRIEDTEPGPEPNTVLIHKPVLPNQNIVWQGEEFKQGQTLFEPGMLLTPAAIGVLASMGIEEVEVYRRPKIGLVITGSELTEVGEPLKPGKIYNSNGYTLKGMLEGLGCEVLLAPAVSDSLAGIRDIIHSFRELDMVISTGGASVGDYDLVREALVDAGAEILFWKVDFKPGTPVALAKRQEQLLFSLSGNPAAALVSFELITKPAILRLAGLKQYEAEFFPVKMLEGFGKRSNQRRFLRAKAEFINGEICANLLSAQESGILLSMVHSNLLIDVPAGSGPIVPGETLQGCFIRSGLGVM